MPTCLLSCFLLAGFTKNPPNNREIFPLVTIPKRGKSLPTDEWGFSPFPCPRREVRSPYPSKGLCAVNNGYVHGTWAMCSEWTVGFFLLMASIYCDLHGLCERRLLSYPREKRRGYPSVTPDHREVRTARTWENKPSLFDTYPNMHGTEQSDYLDSRNIGTQFLPKHTIPARGSHRKNVIYVDIQFELHSANSYFQVWV